MNATSLLPLCILPCALCTFTPAFAGDKAIGSGDTLVFLGDSITDFGAKRSHGYPNLVVKGLAANGIDVAWHGAGIAGDTSADMLGRFDRDVTARKPDVVTISAGVNDVWFHKATFETFCANERSMVAKAKAAGARVVLLSPTTAAGENDRDDLRRFAAGGIWFVTDHCGMDQLVFVGIKLSAPAALS